MRTGYFAFISAALLLAAAASADEGKWPPDQLLDHPTSWFVSLGLGVEPATLWSRDGGGLLEAVANLNGCSSAIISAQGLLVTNYHCALPLIQQHSSAEQDLISRGFLAVRRDDELPCEGTRMTLPHRLHDVTVEMTTAVAGGSNDLSAYRALERKSKELVAACEDRPHRRCSVRAAAGRVRYILAEHVELADVRLVWAPPRSVGEYGGEIDNWMWPRHTGDLVLLRLWADEDNRPAEPDPGNLPFRPRHFLRISTDGVENGSFVLVAGYPSRSLRSLTADEAEVWADLRLPQRSALYSSWLTIMERASATEDEARLALSSRLRALANREKNARGQLAGIARGNLIANKRKLEREVLAWARRQAAHAHAAQSHHRLAALATEERASWDHDFLLLELQRGPLPLSMALTIVRWARERAKPDLNRLIGYQDRDRDRITASLRHAQQRLHLPTEVLLFEDVFSRAAALPQEQRPGPLAPHGHGAAEHSDRASTLIASTRVIELDQRMEMIDEDEAQLRSRQDPLIDLALELDDELRKIDQAGDRRAGTVSRQRPVWRRAVEACLGRPLDPDANGSLRVSFGHVSGYSPRDAVWMHPLTTVSGLVAKHTGTPPFDAPSTLIAAAPTASTSRWSAPGLGDVPVNFLADADTTGGNSGSPVLDGDGNLVGINFDRVWDNIANDIGYNPLVARNISVDIRYLLWLLDRVYGPEGHTLLAEMGVSN